MRLSRCLALLVVAAAVVAAVGGVRARPTPKPNVLLITLDTFRADAVGRGDTPALDAFAAEATRFPGARTVAPLTFVVHATLFSGLQPGRHGVHDNAAPPVPPREARAYTLLAEELRDAGYATGGFGAKAVLAARTGLGAGLDT